MTDDVLNEHDDATEKSRLPFANLSFKDERTRIILGLSVLTISIFLFLSFFSFLFTWYEDQTVLELPLSDFLFNPDVQVANWGAKMGAYAAKKCVHDWFGVPAFSLIFVLVVVGLRLLKWRIVPMRRSFNYALMLTILSSIVLGYVFGSLWDGNLGGGHGYFISRWLSSVFGKVGAGFIILTVVITFTIFAFKAALPFYKRFIRQIQSKITGKELLLEDGVDSVMADDTDYDEEEENEQVAATMSATESAELHEEIVVDLPPAADPREKWPNEHIDDMEIVRPQTEQRFQTEENEEPLRLAPVNELEIEPTIIDSGDDTELVVVNAAAYQEQRADVISNEILGDYDPTLDLAHYKLPPTDLLADHKSVNIPVSDADLKENKDKIVETLLNYKIEIASIKATVGPTVTLYEIVPAPGVRISKIKNLEDDIALSLAALGIRIIAPIPGKGTIGIEVPNRNPEIVSMRSIIESKAFQETKADLPLALGKTISNETYVVDLCKMPHLLIAGATGQGKSVGINAILTSLLYKKHPSQLKFVLIDPKKVELTIYGKIENHFLAKLPTEEEPIITDTKKVVNTLNSLCIEMDTRYNLLKDAKMRNLKEYNAKFVKRQLNPELGHRFLPYIVVIIDEFADLIMTAGKEIELPLARIAQLARAVGIHLIIATQRPTTNIITGVIKANFPARIAFRVSSSTDSRTILDSTGANQLIGRGDMLISLGSDSIRLQCPFVDTPEVELITDFIAHQQGYGMAHLLPEFISLEEGNGGMPEEFSIATRDPMFEEAARVIVASQQGSTSLIQRKFSIGYNRAGRIVDQLEAAGVVGPFEGSKARQVLIQTEADLERLLSTMR